MAALAAVSVIALSGAAAFLVYRRRKNGGGRTWSGKFINSTSKYVEAVIPGSRGDKKAKESSTKTDPAFAKLNRGALKRTKTQSSGHDSVNVKKVTLGDIEKGLANSSRSMRVQAEMDESMDNLLNDSGEEKEEEVTEEEMHTILAPSKGYTMTQGGKRKTQGRGSLLGLFRSSRKSSKKTTETEIRSVAPITGYISKKRKKALKELEDFEV